MIKAIERWKKPLLGFIVGQPVLQLTNLLTGFLLLRWMTVEHYAQLGVAFAFQSTVGMLADLGFSSAIISLAGERGRDPSVIGAYIRSARYFRFLLTVSVGIVFALLFPFITRGQPWSFLTKFLILSSILVAVTVQGWSMYQAPLLANRHIATIYRPQIVCGVVRLGMCGLLHLFQGLTGVAVSWIGAVTMGLSGWWIKKDAQPLVCEPQKADAAMNLEMLRYLSPLIPGIVFTAFQSQIAIGIITVFGSTRNIAEVAALGRLGQLFGVLTAFNTLLIAPYVASLSQSQFRPRYLRILCAALALSCALMIAAYCFPFPLLWLLGPKYANLQVEVVWVIFSACVNYVGGVMWTMNSARKWVYWWSTILYILSVFSVQVLGVSIFDLGSTLGVVYFGVISAVAALGVHVATAIWGFRRQRSDLRDA